MFDSVVISGGENPADWADTFLVDLQKGFSEIGLEAVHLRQKDKTHHLLGTVGRELYARGKSFFLFDINAKTQILTRPGTGPLPRFSLMVDHPASHAHVAAFDGRNLLGVIDRSHLGGVSFSPARRVFVPHGGPLNAAEPGGGERPVDVVFSGNIGAETDRPPDALIGGSPEVGAIAAAAVARSLDGGTESSRALEQALADKGFGAGALGADGYAMLLGFVSGYSQSVMRERVLNRLRGLRVCVVGSVCDRLARQLPEGFEIVKPAEFTDVRTIYAKSKICLNISHKFTDGSHERIWYGMASGCAVLTNSTPYLREYFTDDQSILYYQGCDLDLEKICSVIRSGRTGEIARAAWPVYRANHTWVQRAQIIAETMNQAWPGARHALGTIFS